MKIVWARRRFSEIIHAVSQLSEYVQRTMRRHCGVEKHWFNLGVKRVVVLTEAVLSQY
jgi:hypothetical protein